MSNTGDSPRDKQQLADMMMDCRALLTMTRPLIVTEHSLALWRGGEVYRSGFGISPGPSDRFPESVLSRGEVFRLDEPGLGIADEEGLPAVWEEAATRPALQMRICIGMS
jgi:hypothetical protein